MFHYLFLLLGLVSPMIGNCYTSRYDGHESTNCRYHTTNSGDDGLRATVGTYLVLGPWSDDYDLVISSILVLADKRTIVLNADFGGDSFLKMRGKNGFIANSTFDMTGAGTVIRGSIIRIEK